MLVNVVKEAKRFLHPSVFLSLSLSNTHSRSLVSYSRTLLVIQTKPIFRDNDRFTCSSQALNVICNATGKNYSNCYFHDCLEM